MFKHVMHQEESYLSYDLSSSKHRIMEDNSNEEEEPFEFLFLSNVGKIRFGTWSLMKIILLCLPVLSIDLCSWSMTVQAQEDLETTR